MAVYSLVACEKERTSELLVPFGAFLNFVTRVLPIEQFNHRIRTKNIVPRQADGSKVVADTGQTIQVRFLNYSRIDRFACADFLHFRPKELGEGEGGSYLVVVSRPPMR